MWAVELAVCDDTIPRKGRIFIGPDMRSKTIVQAPPLPCPAPRHWPGTGQRKTCTKVRIGIAKPEKGRQGCCVCGADGVGWSQPGKHFLRANRLVINLRHLIPKIEISKDDQAMPPSIAFPQFHVAFPTMPTIPAVRLSGPT